MMFQHFTFVIKKLNQIYLYYRLKNNLQYNDVAILHIIIVIGEYTFIFDYIMIQNNSYMEQIVAGINFIIIQIYNITNFSLFYHIYQYFKNKSLNFLRGISTFSYFLLFVVTMITMIQVIIYNSIFYIIGSFIYKLV